MAGSRLEKVGTIFSRVNGLLRSKAIKEENKPIWFDIYKTFPPHVAPRYERKVVSQTVPDLLYPEDIVRARFYKLYGNPDVVDLTNEHMKTTCQKLIENYFEIQNKEDIPDNEIFQKAIDILKEQGIRLRTLAEKEAEIAAKEEMSSSENKSTDSIMKTEQSTDNERLDDYELDDNLERTSKTS